MEVKIVVGTTFLLMSLQCPRVEIVAFNYAKFTSIPIAVSLLSPFKRKARDKMANFKF